MGAAYAQDLRDRILAAYDRGMMTHQIAEVFAVSRAWARRVKQRRREFGQTTPRPSGGFRYRKVDLDRLRRLVEEQPDATVRELRERLGVECSDSAVSAGLRRLGLSLKKRRSTRPSRTAPTSRSDASSGSGTSPRATPAG